MLTQRFIYDALPGRPSCHCAMGIELPDRSLLATFYAGTQEGHRDVAVLTARLRPGAEAWDAPQVVSDTPGKPEGNSVLIPAPGGRVHLFYAVIQGNGWSAARLYVTYSDDLGETWSEACDAGLPVGWLVRNKAITLRTGPVLFPIYDEDDWTGLCLISDDGGANWRPSGRMATPDDSGCIQPTLIERENGSIIALLRTGGQGGAIWRSVSDDGGETWSECVATGLPNPNSGIDALRLADGRVVVIYNHTTSGRTPLNLAISEDEGDTWRPGPVLEDEPGEYSYPAIWQTSDGRVQALYTWRRERIRHVSLDEV